MAGVASVTSTVLAGGGVALFACAVEMMDVFRNHAGEETLSKREIIISYKSQLFVLRYSSIFAYCHTHRHATVHSSRLRACAIVPCRGSKIENHRCVSILEQKNEGGYDSCT